MFLCQMSGIPGTGKSTLARHICKMTNAVLLDLDVIKSSVIQSLENNIDSKFIGKVAYEMAFSLAGSNLGIGNSVIIDSSCQYEILIENGTNLAKKYNTPYKFIECYLKDLSESNQRRTMREVLPSQKAFSIPIDEKEFQKAINALKRPAENEYLMIDTSQEIEEYIGDILEYLKSE